VIGLIYRTFADWAGAEFADAAEVATDLTVKDISAAALVGA